MFFFSPLSSSKRKGAEPVVSERGVSPPPRGIDDEDFAHQQRHHHQSGDHSDSGRTSPTVINESDGGEETPINEKPSRIGTFLSTLQRSGTECTLPAEHKHGWKPITLRAPILLPFSVVSVILAVLTEVLAQLSQKNGGLSLASAEDELSPLSTFAFSFLPTIIAVIYGMVWNWIDLDAKRMQPWFELSRPGGATGKNSLFLEYQYDFIATVPFKAGRRRHWISCLSGTVMILIFWILTPLQTAIIGTGLVKVEQSIHTTISAEFVPPNEQADMFDQDVMHLAYATTWLGQDLPPFTTSEYTLLPFSPYNFSDTVPSNANWTGITTKLWTELECWPAEASLRGHPVMKQYDFLNGRGCNVTNVVPYSSPNGNNPYKMLYLGFENSPYVESSLNRTTCSDDAANQFLAVWGAFVDEVNIKASGSFCEATYYKQRVAATVEGASSVPIDDSVVSVGPREELSDTEFNKTAFQFLVQNGRSSVLRDRDWHGFRSIDQFPRLYDTGLSWPPSPMVGFAIGTDPDRPVSEYEDHEKRSAIFRSSQKSFFALAAQHVMREKDQEGAVAARGSVSYDMFGFKASRLFTAIAEGILLFISASSMVLLFLVRWRESFLNEEPGPIDAIIPVVKNSPDLLDEFSGKGNCEAHELEGKFGDFEFGLVCGCRSPSGAMMIKILSIPGSVGRVFSFAQPSGHYEPIRPLALQKWVGATFLLCLSAMLAAMAYLKTEEQRLGGLIRPTDSFEVLQILQSFIPTALATLIGPFWVLINRLLCVLQPFKDLFVGSKNNQGSMSAKYNSVPPQLAVWHAFKTGHWLLAAVCVIALLSDVLSVGLGGLFSEKPIRVNYATELVPTRLPRFGEEPLEAFLAMLFETFPYEEPFIVTNANISMNTDLPTWTTSDFYFQSFATTESSPDNSTEIYRGRTRGYGVDPACEPVSSSTQPPTLDLTDFMERYSIRSGPNCSSLLEPEFLYLENPSNRPPEGPIAYSYVEELSKRAKDPICDRVLIMIWARTANGSDVNGTIDSSFVVCNPQFQTALFDVTVDSAGHVLEYKQATDMEGELEYPESRNHTDKLLNKASDLVLDNQMRRWDNETLTRNWMSYMIKLITNDTDPFDPHKPVPDPELMAPRVEDMYKRFFTTMVALNSDIFDNDTSSEPAFTGERWVLESRIFMSTPALIVSATVLALGFLVAIWLYGWSITFFLPRMPTNIASVLAYVAPSRAVRDFDTEGHPQQAKTFSFGRYVGDDGRAHVGIEMDPFVVPIGLKSLKRGNTMPKASWIESMRGRKATARIGDAWL